MSLIIKKFPCYLGYPEKVIWITPTSKAGFEKTTLVDSAKKVDEKIEKNITETKNSHFTAKEIVLC